MDSEQQYDVSESDSEYDSDDSQEDPTFDLMEETRSSLSKLSIKKQKSKDMSARRNVTKALEDCVEEEQELDEKDKKSYETVQKIIKAGQIEKLKVEQCKVYLRKHGLRLTGSKDTLIQRIKEHTDILDGHGVEKYPPSSFVLNCKGDACTGDVVMFEQNVYEMFSIASRSATGPPCGTRIVAGRVVKESYGAKKQQHTFTVEVLWSKGEKSLPPLHPLLIKGRNLYRLTTLRQKWDNEAERQKILSEKHARGSVARSNRETRVQEKEMRKMRREHRVSTDCKEKKTVAESKGKQLHARLMNSLNKKDGQPQVEVVDNSQKDEQKEFRNYTNAIHENVFPRENRPEERPNQRQPLTNVNLNDPSSYKEQQGFGVSYISNPSKSPSRMHTSNVHNIPTWRGYSSGSYNNYNTSRSPLQGHGHMYTGGHGHSQNMNYKSPQRTESWQARNGWCNAGVSKRPYLQGQREEQKKPCRFYAQGRCYYGHSCKYLHDSVFKHSSARKS